MQKSSLLDAGGSGGDADASLSKTDYRDSLSREVKFQDDFGSRGRADKPPTDHYKKTMGDFDKGNSLALKRKFENLPDKSHQIPDKLE